MQTRFKNKAKVFDIGITAVAGMLSVGIMLYGVFHFGQAKILPELVLNLFYIACLVMIWMYFFRADLSSDRDSRGQARCHLLRGKEGFLHVR